MKKALQQFPLVLFLFLALLLLWRNAPLPAPPPALFLLLLLLPLSLLLLAAFYAYQRNQSILAVVAVVFALSWTGISLFLFLFNPEEIQKEGDPLFSFLLERNPQEWLRWAEEGGALAKISFFLFTSMILSLLACLLAAKDKLWRSNKWFTFLSALLLAVLFLLLLVQLFLPWNPGLHLQWILPLLLFSFSAMGIARIQHGRIEIRRDRKKEEGGPPPSKKAAPKKPSVSSRRRESNPTRVLPEDSLGQSKAPRRDLPEPPRPREPSPSPPSRAIPTQEEKGVAPGWYLDPQGEKRARYWDGNSWTDQLRDL